MLLHQQVRLKFFLTFLESNLNNSLTHFFIDICTPTVIFTFIHHITINAPFFGVVFYYAHWAFLGVTLLGLMYAMIRSPNNMSYDDLEDEISEEEQGLLANIGR